MSVNYINRFRLSFYNLPLYSSLGESGETVKEIFMDWLLNVESKSVLKEHSIQASVLDGFRDVVRLNLIFFL